VNKPVQIAVIAVCVGASAYLLYGFFSKPSPTANEGIPEFLHYKCPKPDCGHEFSWQRGTDTGDRSIDTCPECGTIEATRAAKCQACGMFQAMSGHGSYEKICPGCGVELVPLRDQR
jgi:ribosomal protein S27E